MSDTEEPLLVDGQEVGWDRIEEGQYKGAVTVQQLISQDPDHVIAYIKERGVSGSGTLYLPLSFANGSCMCSSRRVLCTYL